MRQSKSNTVVVLAFDPGIYHCGWSVSKVDRDTYHATVTSYGTIEAAAAAKKANKKDYQDYGNIISFFLLEQEVKELVETYHPDYVVSEGAFMARFVNAFVSLKLCINAIQRVLYSEFRMTLYQIAPKEAKKAVNIGTADKEAVQTSITKLPDLTIKETKQKPLIKMCEHEADSIAIGYAFVKNVLPGLLLVQNNDQILKNK